MQALNPFVPFLFLKMICKKKKLSLVTGTDGNFQLSGDCFCSTAAEPQTGKSHLHQLLVKDSYNLYPAGTESE